ncbi:MAG: DNA repair protein RecN [Betaproteobacteria bacterium]|nr:DNA repair protein RecN [Betaproteobacteria bacterium]
MLRSLSIRDFVIVDRMDLEFAPGFTVLTGETGAGKSILVDALAMVLGERGDAAAVRQGAERAEISAEFEAGTPAALARWLADNELADDPGTCLMRRLIDAGGRSRAFINGRPVTLAQLREAGEFLVDIHGQHVHQSLTRGAAQRELLDAYAGLRGPAQAVAAVFRHWQEAHARRLALESNAAAYAAEREQLEWQIRELAALNFTVEEWQALGAEHSRLAHAAALIETAQYGLEALSEGENASLAQLNDVISRLNHLVEYDAALRGILEILEPAQVQVQEAVYSLRHYQQRIELDPQRLREVESRLEAIHAAARRHRVSPEALPETLARFRARLEELGGGGDIEALRRQEEAARENYLAQAKKLGAGRRKAARELAQKVTEAMRRLAMTGGAFDVGLTVLAEGNSHGLEQVEFLVAAHKGMEPRPIARVASGGELSRISLAIQTVTSRVAQVPTLIFDEVDTGIGGRVAEIVGRMLKQLGREHQVMCVTHLPQVAAAGDQQWQVTKSQTDGGVLSTVTVLDGQRRVEEIARMLGGVKITETTRKHAAEMLGL